MSTECTICFGNSIILKDKNFSLYHCNFCQHTFSDILKEKQEKYGGDYFIETHRRWFANPNYKLFNFIYSHILRFRENDKELKLLDIGSGNGDFLKEIEKKDSKIKLFGIDMSENEYSYRDSQISFIRGDFLLDDMGDDFDIAVSLAVIEHIDDPTLFVQKINKLLKVGGFVYVMTVNENSLVYIIARLIKKIGMRSAFDRLYSPHHLQHFSNESLKKLMELNNFEVVVQKNHNYNIKAVDVPESNIFIKIIYRVSIGILFFLSKPLGLGILQTIVCRKRSD